MWEKCLFDLLTLFIVWLSRCCLIGFGLLFTCCLPSVSSCDCCAMTAVSWFICDACCLIASLWCWTSSLSWASSSCRNWLRRFTRSRRLLSVELEAWLQVCQRSRGTSLLCLVFTMLVSYCSLSTTGWDGWFEFQMSSQVWLGCCWLVDWVVLWRIVLNLVVLKLARLFWETRGETSAWFYCEILNLKKKSIRPQAKIKQVGESDGESEIRSIPIFVPPWFQTQNTQKPQQHTISLPTWLTFAHFHPTKHT